MAALTPAAGPSGTGSMTLQGPNTNSAQTVNIPDATGTMMVSGNMPAFSAYLSSSQTVTANTPVKIQCNTKEFDTANAYDNVTNYRFAPQVAGYYQVNMGLSTGTAATATVLSIYKNGSSTKSLVVQSNNGITCIWNLAALVYLNGSTDYLEFYGQSNGATTFVGGVAATFVQAALMRAA